MDKEKSNDNQCNNKAHYWVLDDKSFGVCKKCGARKQFSVEGFGWQNSNVVIGKNMRTAAK